MLDCWELDPKDRPSFHSLLEIMSFPEKKALLDNPITDSDFEMPKEEKITFSEESNRPPMLGSIGSYSSDDLAKLVEDEKNQESNASNQQQQHQQQQSNAKKEYLDD